MIIQLASDIQAPQLENLYTRASAIGYQLREVKTQFAHYLIGVGKAEFDIREIGGMAGIQDIHRVTDTYKLVSRKWRVSRTVIDLGDGVRIGDGELAIMSGPCSIEGEAQIKDSVDHLAANEVRIMRGGVYKPRSSPYSFRGLGLEGLKLFSQSCRERGIKIITEVMQPGQIEAMAPYVDIFQVGARNSQNFNLLDALGQVDKPVMLKRGISGTLSELLHSAEYIYSGGNERILLCERGIRSFEQAYRNTLDLNAIPVLKEKTHLPVIVDPSHGIGLRRHVARMAMAGVIAGADGVIVEVHKTPEKAYSDGQQTLNFQEAERLYAQLRSIRELEKELF